MDEERTGQEWHGSIPGALPVRPEAALELFETITEGILYLHSDGEIFWANRAAGVLLGVTVDEMLGRSSLDPRWKAIHEDGSEFLKEDRASMVALRTGKPVRDVTVGIFNPRDNAYRWLNLNAIPQFHDGEAIPYQVCVTFSDITERKQMLQQLQESEQRFKLFMEHLPGAVFIKDKDGRMVYCNQAYAATINTTPEELLGRTSDSDMPPELAAQFREENRKILEDNQVLTEEHTFPGPDGPTYWLTIKFPIQREGKPSLLGAMSLDVTEDKRRQLALAENEARLNAIFRAAPIGIGLVKDRVILEANDQVCQISGYSHSELLGQSTRILYPNQEEYETVGQRKYAQMDDFGMGTVETHWQHKDGHRVDILLSSTYLIVDDPQSPAAFTAMDITESRAAQRSLQESEERFRTIFETMIQGVMYYDSEFNLAYANPAAGRILGRTMENMYETGLLSPDWRVISEDGSPLPAEEFPAVRSMRTGQPNYDFVMGVEKPETGDRVWLSVNTTPVFSPDKESPRLVYTIFEDITERRHMERQVRQQERLAAVGQLSAGIAHDFNNLLTAIIGYAELLQLRPELAEEPALDHIVEQGERAAQLTRQILDFSRQSSRNPRPLDLAAYMKQALDFVERTIPEKVRVHLEAGESNYIVNADPTQLQQVLTNLALNARDAMPNGGDLTFSLSRFHLDPGTWTPALDLTPGSYVVLRVSDTGMGVPAEVLPHLFEPFFSTKEPGKGTGLGLAQVYGIVKQHEGEITVESQSGRGTTFNIYLPAIEGAPRSAEAEGISALPKGQGQTLLLVEDNPRVQEVTQAMLEQLNYQVITAGNGEEALAIFRQRQKEISLIISDAVMPKMDGLQLVTALAAEFPDIRVLMISGYQPSSDWNELSRQHVVAWLQKPPSMRELAEVLSQAVR